MRHSSVDKRSKRYAARQFVSEYTIEARQELQVLDGNENRLPKEQLERCQGVIKFFDKGKGYGFCKRQGALDVFFHAKSLERAGINVDEINKGGGDTLEFDLVPVPGKGGKAINIKLLAKGE